MSIINVLLSPPPASRWQIIRGRGLILASGSLVLWDVVSALGGWYHSAAAGHLACELDFVRWPGAWLLPQRYTQYVLSHCASGDFTGVLSNMVLLGKVSIASLLLVFMLAAWWPQRHTPREVMAQYEKDLLQNAFGKSIVGSRLVLTRIVLILLVCLVVYVVPIQMFSTPPELLPSDLRYLLSISGGVLCVALFLSVIPPCVALLVKRR